MLILPISIQMARIGNRSFGAIAISGALIGSGMLGFALWSGFPFSKSIFIEELGELPVGSAAHLEGRVTYADVPGMRFWIQDQTGAIVIPQSPSNAGVHVGDTVAVDATKASRYAPIQGPGSDAFG
jgi:hypothetical protein